MSVRSYGVVGGALVGVASATLGVIAAVALIDSLGAAESPDRLTQALGPYFAVAAVIGMVVAAVGLTGGWHAIQSSGDRPRLGIIGGIAVFASATLVLLVGVSAPVVPIVGLAGIGVLLLLLGTSAADASPRG